MSRAFEQLFGVRDAFRGVPMAGRTDTWILSDALAGQGISASAEHASAFRDAYLGFLAEELDSPGPRKGIMPGVRELLEALLQPDVYLALLTGNYQGGARAKLEYFDLWRYFRCGAFGDDAPDRNGLLPKALDAVAAHGGPKFAAANAVVIGDTPLDVACAASGGARCLAVATGSHSVDELRAAGAETVFEDLTKIDAVLRAIRAR
jgi:phosphoglycolate phosphatase-like HAD superfamily hydrolase